MPIHVVSERIGKKLFRNWIYDGDQPIGEYERSQEADIVRKRKEVANAKDLLMGVYAKHGRFQVRWDGTRRRKVIRAGDVEVGEIPESMWERPSWK